MKLLIVGGGEVGSYISKQCSNLGHDVTLIEQSQDCCNAIDEEQNIKVIHGNGASAEVLVNSGVNKVDYFLAMTMDDTTNLIACSLAKVLGAKYTIARIHDQTYNDYSYVNYQLHFNIDLLVNPEALCAVELAKHIRNPGRVAVENFSRGQIEVQQVAISGKSIYVGYDLQSLKMHSEVRIVYMQRADRFIIPKGNTVLQEGDLITLVGSQKSLEKIKHECDPTHSNLTNEVSVILYGLTETSMSLISSFLSGKRFKIRLIEKDTKKCQYIADKFSHVMVIQGDATSLRLLEEEQIEACDYFIACTKDDENNIMTALQAKGLGAKHVGLVINSSDYELLLNDIKDRLHLDYIVSPRLSTMQEMERYILRENWTELVDFADGELKIGEVKVSPESACIGKKICEIVWPIGASIIAIHHKFQTKVATAQDDILAGDRLVFISKRDHFMEFVKMLIEPN